jgi:hypothetical protein
LQNSVEKIKFSIGFEPIMWDQHNVDSESGCNILRCLWVSTFKRLVDLSLLSLASMRVCVRSLVFEKAIYDYFQYLFFI